MKRSLIAPLFAATIFVLLSAIFVSYPGVHNDEAIFASALFGRHTIPIMVMSYAGALKAWLYAPIFALFGASALSLRVPVILLGAADVAIFYRCITLMHSRRAAIFGALLLATDPVFLLTNCFDWGPVALQHFFLISGIWVGLKYRETPRKRWIFLLFMIFGLALWEKALFIWPLVGMAVASLLLFPRKLLGSLSTRHIGLATAGFCLGALPLIYFNIKHPLETFRANAALDASALPRKVAALTSTLDGSALFGYLVDEESTAHARAPQFILERTSIFLRQALGAHRKNLTKIVLAICIFLLPVIWRSRARLPCLFALIAMIAAWLQMAFARNAGGAAHHTILLWPLPMLFIAMLLAELSTRAKRLGAVGFNLLFVLMCGSNLLVLNQYFSQLLTFGSPSVWSDAMYTLSADLPRYGTDPINLVDWGMFDALNVLHKGELRLEAISRLFLPGNDEAELRAVTFADEKAVWVTHSKEQEAFAGINDRWLGMAQEAGYAPAPLETIHDRYDNAIFELFRLKKVTAPRPAPPPHVP